jgi:ABC-type multidrug transport system fused ATPase/permease subunit
VAGATVVARLRLKLFKNLLRQEISFFDAHATGELTSRLTGDAAKLS